MKKSDTIINMNISALWWVIAPLIFVVTQSASFGPWKLILVLLSLLWLLADNTLFLKNSIGEQITKRKLTDITVFCLFLVGATNWFFSPFFFVLYLLVVAITFVMGIKSGLGFVSSLVVLFVFNVGQVDVTYDSLVLLSLLATFPLALYLRKEYLNLQEAHKKILILERDQKENDNTVERLLTNVVTSFSAELRQPLVNAKNYTHMLNNRKLPAEKIKEYTQKVYDCSQIALKELNMFDEAVTGMKIKSKK